MKTSVISMVFLCLVVSTTQVEAQTWSAAEKEVLQAIDDCNRAYKEENLEALLSTCYHDDYVTFRYGSPNTFNKADARKNLPIVWASSEQVEWWIKPLAIRIVGDVAVVHYYRYGVSRDKDGKQMNSRGRYTDVWVKEEGKWSKIANHGGSDLPPGN